MGDDQDVTKEESRVSLMTQEEADEEEKLSADVSEKIRLIENSVQTHQQWR